jgi:hypothetical protein
MDMTTNINRRGLLASGLACGVAALGGGARPAAAATGNPPVLVELFTSQGCSSCPPADEFMAELVNRPGIIAVSLNVDYWNYLGWQDTLSQPLFSRRQKDYATRRGDGRVYTPQMVINGRTHVVGSHRDDVLAEISQQSSVPDRYFVPIEMGVRGSELDIMVGGSPTDRIIQDSTVWVMSVAPEVTVQIERGENSGRTVTYHNVVRRLTPAAMWKGQQLSISLPRKHMMDKQASNCVVVLQGDNGGVVLGCAHMAASS